MPTIRLVPSSYGMSNTNYITVTNPSNMYTNTDSTTYATCTTTRAATTTYYVFIRGFNFDAIPQGAHVTSYTVKIKGYETGLNTSTSYAPRLTNDLANISGTSAASSTFGTSTKTITVPSNIDWDTLVGYGNNLCIRVTVKRAASGTKGYLYIYGAEIEVTYSYLPQGLGFRIKNNGSWIEPQKIYAKSGGTWHLAQSIYVNVGGGWIPNSVDPTGHSIWVDDFPYDENNPDDPYNDSWANSFYEEYSMGQYLLSQTVYPSGTKYNYVGPMEFNGRTIFLWQVALDTPSTPDPSTIKYAATTTNDINLLRSMSVSNYDTDEGMVAAISPGGSALNKIMLLSSDIGTYEDFSNDLGGEVLVSVI